MRVKSFLAALAVAIGVAAFTATLPSVAYAQHHHHGGGWGGGWGWGGFAAGAAAGAIIGGIAAAPYYRGGYYDDYGYDTYGYGYEAPVYVAPAPRYYYGGYRSGVNCLAISPGSPNFGACN